MSCSFLDNYRIKKAVKIVQSGGVIIYPTEAVFGIGCDPKNLSALKKIVDIKSRDSKKGLIIVASSYEQILGYINPIPKDIENRLRTNWPGQTTYIFPANEMLSDYLIGGNNKTIAIRVSKNKYIKKLCDLLGHPLVSTSANISGMESITSYKQAKEEFQNKVDYILPGKVDINLKPSKIIDIFTSKVLR